MSLERSQQASFSECDQINEFYKALGVKATEWVGPFGGKTFHWIVYDGKESLNVRCFCTTATLGYGKLRISTREEKPLFSSYFKPHPFLDPKNARMILSSPFNFKEKEINLPIPSTNQKI